MLRLTADMRNTILIAARDAAPREACGLAYPDYIICITNVSPSESFFAMDIEEMAAAYDSHGAPVGVWHSHPYGPLEPSITDWEFIPPEMLMIICDLHEVRTWPYSSRPS